MTRRADLVRDLFQSALDLPANERPGFVADAAGGDPDVEREVLGLLAALDAATGFLTEAPRPSLPSEGPGTVLDRYRLVAPIGEGGFGVVYRAEQEEPMRREVAVKLLKPGMDSRAVTARFERERQTLARMQHPGIAAVFDGGTTPAGRPYFVMELVEGLPIAQYCREQGLGISERVELLLQVCLAVQHAHQKGVVHRDLKPANILVARAADGAPQPKVIDFGIAKVTWGDGEPAFTATRPGQAMGTLEYMAPEQAAGDIAQLDSRADVYSLGVILYELLTGRRPFERADDDRSSTTSLVDRIRDERPLRPSARIAAGDTELPLPGADRQRWRRHLAEDLDWIVAHALAKQPAHRYATADALAMDLRNHLDGRPVSVGPPRLSYVVRKFVARHRVIVGAAVLLVLSLVGGIVATAAALAKARDENGHKQRTLLATRGLLLAADPHAQKGPDYTVRQMLDDFAPSIDAQFHDDPQVAASLHLTVGASYRNLAQLSAAEPHLRRALAWAQASGDPLEHEVALIEWVALLRELGRYDEAARSLDDALRLAEQRAPDSVARLRLDRADLHRLRSQPDLGEPIARAALAQLDRSPDAPQTRAQRAYAVDLLGAFAL
ncbi:MAG: serine/threonine protein kinase [Phycisphaerales bacterium]|nr:serine/threonine protein kinase [Phycisphaerales bacterium]